jgi:hypothetical protein
MPVAAAALRSSEAEAAQGPGEPKQAPPAPAATAKDDSDPESPLVQLPSPSRRRAAAWEDSAAAADVQWPGAGGVEPPQQQCALGSHLQPAAAAGAAGLTVVPKQPAAEHLGAADTVGGWELPSQVGHRCVGPYTNPQRSLLGILALLEPVRHICEALLQFATCKLTCCCTPDADAPCAGAAAQAACRRQHSSTCVADSGTAASGSCHSRACCR